MKFQEIFNLTPHPITLRRPLQPDRIFQPVGVARVKQNNVFEDYLGDSNEDLIPLYKAEFGEVEGLPEPRKGFYFIVSSLVAAACPDRNDLLVPTEFLET